MKCPDCAKGELKASQLENQLPAHTCEACGGYWIADESYRAWRAQRSESPKVPPEACPPPAQSGAEQGDQALLCPDCGLIMLKWRVGHGLSFMIDRCSHCGGIWLGSREWQALKGQHLHEEIDRVFSTAWQAADRRASMRTKLRDVYKERFGRDYQKVEDFRRWVHQQPCASQILSYLQEADPFSLLSNRDVDQAEATLQARLRNLSKDDGSVTASDPG